jgi:phytoene dehydrogenase-like protein
MSGFMTQVIACALQLGGMPVPKGGGIRLVDGLASIIRSAGGELRTEAEVERVLVSDGKATGVRLADGETVLASRAVLACVTPTQLYGRLLSDGEVPPRVAEAAMRFRYGRGEMQIHIAMNELPRWKGDERLARVPLLHLTSGLDGVSRAVNEADRGLLPAESTIALGQPAALDPSRVPEGSWVIWVQLQELPSRPKGDAAGELAALIQAGDGTWTEELREAYADRIVERIGRHVENLASATVARVVYSPADMEAANPNWVGGDIYAGSCSLDQNLLFRPTAATPGHETPVERLFHIGASTHPGPGLGAGSGYLVAKLLTRPPLARRLLSRLPGVP